MEATSATLELCGLRHEDFERSVEERREGKCEQAKESGILTQRDVVETERKMNQEKSRWQNENSLRGETESSWQKVA